MPLEKISLYDNVNSLFRKYIPIQIPTSVKNMDATATRINDLNIKIAIRSPTTFAITIKNTFNALMFGLLSVHQNYFLTVGEYNSLKRTQHIIGSQLPCLFVDFDLIQTRDADKISKLNFKDYAGSFRLKKFLELDTVGTKPNVFYHVKIRNTDEV